MDEATKAPASSFEENLATIDQSLGFLVLLILAVLLSYYSVTIQRQQLILSEQNPQALECLPRLFPIKVTASALVLGSLGYFLALSTRQAEAAQKGTDPVSKKSSGLNWVAALFVLAAAMIRFYDLHFVEQNRPILLEEDVLPD